MTSNHLKTKFDNPDSSFQNGWHFMIPRNYGPSHGPTRAVSAEKLPCLSNYFHSTATPQASENFCWSMSWWMKNQSGILVRDIFCLSTKKTEKGSINDSHIYAKPKVSTYQPKNTYKQTKYWYILKLISNPATPPTWSKQRMHSAVFLSAQALAPHLENFLPQCHSNYQVFRRLRKPVPATYIPMIYMPGCFHVFFCFSKSLVEISAQI